MARISRVTEADQDSKAYEVLCQSIMNNPYYTVVDMAQSAMGTVASLQRAFCRASSLLRYTNGVLVTKSRHFGQQVLSKQLRRPYLTSR